MKALNKALNEGGRYIDVAREVARHGADDNASAVILDTLLTSLDSGGSLHRLRKAVLGLGLLVATQPTDEAQSAKLSATFGKLLRDPPEQEHASLREALLCTELAYLDQFVEPDTRAKIKDAWGKTLERVPWSPAIRDYIEAWSRLSLSSDLNAIQGAEDEKSDRPRLVLVMSQKGGTGKSVTATAALNFLRAKGLRCGFVDLDSSGPTAQYNFDISRIRGAMAAAPSELEQSQSVWCYPTLLDVLEAADQPGPERRAAAQKAAAEVLLTDSTGTHFVLLPESPTFCARVASLWDDDVSRRAILLALDSCMETFSQKGCNHVVLDMGPGLYGTNGMIIKWASRNYKSVPVVLTSPRASDIATSVYETPWLAAGYEFEWAGPLLHLVNMWQHEREILKGESADALGEYETAALEHLLLYAERAICQLIEGKKANDFEVATSGSQIQAWRFWPLLYQEALSNGRGTAGGKQILRFLPEDSLLRELFAHSFSPTDPFKVRVDTLMESTWYRTTLAPLFEESFQEIIAE